MKNQLKTLQIKKDGVVVFESNCELCTESEFIKWLNGPYEQLSQDLSFFDNKNSSDVIAIKALTAAVSVENETLIAMSNCLHDSIINGLDAFVKRRIWKRKMKRVNKRNR